MCEAKENVIVKEEKMKQEDSHLLTFHSYCIGARWKNAAKTGQKERDEGGGGREEGGHTLCY